MQVPFKQLPAHLKNKLAPIYLINSDVPLLLQEARDAIRHAARQAGFLNYELLLLEAGFNWEHFSTLTQNLSLFSEKTLIDLRNPNNKFDDKGLEHILAFCQKPSPDHVVIISMPKLTSAQQNAAWFKNIDKAGVSVIIWPLYPNELRTWIEQRLRAANLNASQDSIELLIELTAGNMLATQQTIEKLRLLTSNNQINRAQMLQAIVADARYSVFDLTQAILLGQSAQVVRMIEQLPYTDAEPPLLLWAITQDIRELIQLRTELDHGKSMNQVLASQRPSRKTPLQVALQRLNQAQLFHALQLAARIDLTIKGLALGEPWQALTQLALFMSNQALTYS